MHGILRHSMLNVASMIVSTGAGLVVTVIVARLLGPSGSGLVAFALWAAISLCALTDRGIPQTVLRYAAAAGTEEERRELVGSAFRRFLRLPLLAFALGCAGAIMLAADLLPVDRELLLAGAMAFMLYALASFSISASRGRGEFLVPAVNIIAGSLLQIPLVVIGAWFAGAAGALAAIATRFLPQTLHLFRILDRRSLAPDKPPEADMRAYGRAMWISDVVNIVVLGRVEYLVLAVFLSSTDLGLFAVAIAFAGLIEQLTLQLSSPLIVAFSAGPAAAASPAQGEPLYRRSLAFLSMLVLPVALGSAALIPAILPAVFGRSFESASWPAMVLLAAAASSGLSVVPWAYLAANGHSKILMRITLASASISLPVLCLAVAAAGVPGAAYARLANETAILVALLVAAWRLNEVRAPVLAVARVLLAALLCAMVAFALCRTIGGGAGIFAAVPAGMLAYAVALRFLRAVPRHEILPAAKAVAGHLPAPLASALIGVTKFVSWPG